MADDVLSKAQSLAKQGLISPEELARIRPSETMSDANPEPVKAGEQYAQSSPYQIRPNQDGTHSVLNIRTGQIHFTGTPSGASNAQATLNARNR
jgi:hypothetical protein